MYLLCSFGRDACALFLLLRTQSGLFRREPPPLLLLLRVVLCLPPVDFRPQLPECLGDDRMRRHVGFECLQRCPVLPPRELLASGPRRRRSAAAAIRSTSSRFSADVRSSSILRNWAIARSKRSRGVIRSRRSIVVRRMNAGSRATAVRAAWISWAAAWSAVRVPTTRSGVRKAFNSPSASSTEPCTKRSRARVSSSRVSSARTAPTLAVDGLVRALPVVARPRALQFRRADAHVRATRRGSR